jgi:hypothetical protein
MQKGLRERLMAEITSKHVDISRKDAVKAVARSAGIEYSTLARYLLYDPPRTYKLRNRTVDSLALVLDVNPAWLHDGQSPKQLSLWPILVAAEPETSPSDPIEQLERVIVDLRQASPDICLLACRAAISAILDVAVTRGTAFSADSYRSLMRLDASCRRDVERLA